MRRLGPLRFLMSRQVTSSVNRAVYNYNYNVHTIAITNVISRTMRIARSARDCKRRIFVRMRALSM